MSRELHCLKLRGRLFHCLEAETLKVKHFSPTTNALLGMVRRVLSDIDHRVRVGVYTEIISLKPPFHYADLGPDLSRSARAG